MPRTSPTRDALVQAALRLFSQHGYDATTVADIAAAAGVTERTFFHHFGSKVDAVYPEAGSHRDGLREAIRRRAGSRSALDGLVDAVAAFSATIEPEEQRRLIVRTQLVDADRALEEEVLAVMRRWERELASEFAALGGDDEPGAADRVLASLAVSLLVEVAKAANEDEPLERTCRRVGDELVRVLRT